MTSSRTYQDFESAADTRRFILDAIKVHRSSDEYQIAVDADEYDRQRNVTINRYARILYGMRTGEDGAVSIAQAEDFTASNNRLASNFFNRLNTQRADYSLANGVSFVQPDEEDVEDKTKAAMGPGFDHVVHEGAYDALKHGVSFMFWDHDRVHEFPFTQFVPLYDERTGELRAGIRFWRLDDTRPLNVTFYREDGYSEWREDAKRELKPLDAEGGEADGEVLRPYVTTVAYLPADDEVTVVGGENYGRLPIVPMWASRLKQSTLVGMREHIDAYDLIKSGFADDVQDCAMVYWIVRNAGGMDDDDLRKFRDRLKLEKIAKVDGYDGAEAVPYTQEIPTAARTALLAELRDGIYEDFGGLDVHAVAAGATNDHIDAAYQPMDENAASFEYWVGECIRQLVRLAGMDDEPVFQRNRISNQKEQVEMVAMEAQWLDSRTILQLLPNVRPSQVAAILQAMEEEDMGRFGIAQTEPDAAEYQERQ